MSVQKKRKIRSNELSPDYFKRDMRTLQFVAVYKLFNSYFTRRGLTFIRWRNFGKKAVGPSFCPKPK